MSTCPILNNAEEILQALGIPVVPDWGASKIRVEGCGGRFPVPEASLFVANSGTSLRFLTAMLATGAGTYHLDGTPRMRQQLIQYAVEGGNGLHELAVEAIKRLK